MPAALAAILPILLGFGGGFALPRLLKGAGASATLTGKVPRVASALGKLGGGAFIAPMAGFFGGEALGHLLLPSPEEANTDDANFARLLQQMQQGPPTSQNDLEFLRLLQRQNLEGGLLPALEEAGVNVGALV